MQQAGTHRAQDLAVYSAAVTHLGLPAGISARHLPDNPRASVFERTETRVVAIALGAVSPEAGSRHLERVFGWPKWQHPQLPEAGERWSAVFRGESRSWEGIIQMNPGGKPKIMRAGQYATPVTDEMWQMLHDTQTVVLCGGLRGEPTGQQMAAAIAQGRMNAVLAGVLVE